MTRRVICFRVVGHEALTNLLFVPRATHLVDPNVARRQQGMELRFVARLLDLLAAASSLPAIGLSGSNGRSGADDLGLSHLTNTFVGLGDGVVARRGQELDNLSIATCVALIIAANVSIYNAYISVTRGFATTGSGRY